MSSRRPLPVEAKPKSAGAIWRALSLVAAILLLLFVVFALTGMVNITSVRSGAMSPTIEKGDRLLVLRFGRPRPALGDIVVFQTKGVADLGGGLLALRVAGRPGDELELRDGVLYVNGTPAGLANAEGALKYRSFPTANYLNAFRRVVTVPQDRYFLLGDQTANNNDSRFWGFVPATNVVGKVTLRVGPMKRVGKVR